MAAVQRLSRRVKYRMWILVRSVIILMAATTMAGLVARGFWVMFNWGWTGFGTI